MTDAQADQRRAEVRARGQKKRDLDSAAGHPTPGTLPDLKQTAHSTAQVPPNQSQLFKDYKQKQEEWATRQQLSGRPVTMVQLKPPKPQPKKQQATASHKITSFFLPR